MAPSTVSQLKESRSVKAEASNSPSELQAEAGLLSRLRAGDEAAYETLVREHAGRLLAVARRFLGCEQDSADVVQDAFLSAFQSIDTFQGQSQVGTWLQRIVINAALMKLRSRSRRPAVSIDQLLPQFDETGHHVAAVRSWQELPPEVVLGNELRQQVRCAIDQLPEPYRTILLLRDIEQLDTDQTAQLLAVSTAVVKTRLHRARQALRTLLEPVFCHET